MPRETGGHVRKIGEFFAGEVRIEVHLRLFEGKSFRPLVKLVGGGLHELGVEGCGDRERHRLFAHPGKGFGDRGDRVLLPGDDRLGGGIEVDRDDVSGGLFTDGGDRFLVRAEDGGHRPARLRGAAAHRFGTQLDESKAFLHRKHPGGDHRGVFAERVPRYSRKGHAGLLKAGKRRERRRHDGGLGHLGGGELPGGAVAAEGEQVVSEDSRSRLENGPRSMGALGQLRRHARLLGALSGKQECVHKKRPF